MQPRLQIAKALGAKAIVTSSSDDKRPARELGADATVNHATEDVVAAVKEANGGPGADIVLEHVGEATWQRTLQAVRSGGRITVCGATSGPNPGCLHRLWWKQSTVYGSTMGMKEDFEGAYELIASGRARPIVDRVFPLAEDARRARVPRGGEQLGKVVLSIPG